MLASGAMPNTLAAFERRTADIDSVPDGPDPAGAGRSTTWIDRRPVTLGT